MTAGIPAWAALVSIQQGSLNWPALLAAFLGGTAFWKFVADLINQKRADKLAAARDGREAPLDHVELVSKAWTEYDRVIDRLSKAEKRVQAADDRANKAERTARDLRTDLEDVKERLTHVEADTAHVVGFLVVVREGVEAGTIPPWPDEPAQVTAILSRVYRKE